MTTPSARPSDLAAGRRRGRRADRCAGKSASPRAQAAAERRKPRYLSGAAIQRVRGGHGVARRRGRGRERQDRAFRLRSACRVRRLEPDRPPHHPSQRQAAMERRALGAGPGRVAAGHERRRRGVGLVRPWRMPAPKAMQPALAAAAECGFATAGAAAPAAVADEAVATPSPLWQVDNSRGKAFVDFQNDVTVSDVKLAAREGFRIPEHLKRYTTLGMATDQGKTSNAQRRGGARQRHRALCRRGRHHDLPSALHPDRHQRLCRASPRPGFPPRAARAVACLGGGAGRRVRRDRPVAARALLPEARRGAARRGEPRGGECPQRASACATCRRSARSTCRGGTPASSSTASMPTPSRRCRSARRATG